MIESVKNDFNGTDKKTLQEAIRQSGKTQKQIAEELHIKQQAEQYESGKTMPALDTFANLCKVLNPDVNESLCVR